MPLIVIFGSVCSGHGCFPPRPNDAASPNVFANSLGIHRVGDHWEDHCCGPACHDSHQGTGSPNVFVNSIPVARVGDSILCGSTNVGCSPNVHANG